MNRSGHLQVLAALNASEVDYLLVGALALGHYAPDAASFYVTADCDLLVRPTAANLRKALRVLVRCSYSLTAGGEPLVRVDSLVLKRLLERRIAVRSDSATGMPIDVLVDAIGYTYAQWRRTRKVFKVKGVRVPCAGLEQVLESKRLAGRDKDKKLLALYETAYKPLLSAGAKRSRSPRRRRAA